MKPLDHIVFVVDDDRGICDAVVDLLSTFDLHVVAFGSAAEYVAYPKPDVPACLVLDVELPDANGLDLQGQTFTTGTSADGDLLLLLSGGGTIEMNGVAPAC